MSNYAFGRFGIQQAPPPVPQGYDASFGPNGMNVTQHSLGRRVPSRTAGLAGSFPTPQAGGPSPGSMNQNFGTQMSNAPIGAGALRAPHNSPGISQPVAQAGQAQAGGVRPGTNMMGGPSVAGPSAGGPSLQQIQAEMQRRQVGSQLGPRNAALAGYMMGQ